jgi:hypothetical protein
LGQRLASNCGQKKKATPDVDRDKGEKGKKNKNETYWSGVFFTRNATF